MLRPDNQPVGCLLAGLGAVPGVRHRPHARIPAHLLLDPPGAAYGSAPPGIPDAGRRLCLRALAPALPRLNMSGRAPLPLRILGRLIGLAIIVTGIAAAVMAARTSTGNPRTDDAYVSANVIGIAPHVQGPLVQLNVVDNQPVEENDLLFVVDPRPYEAELQRARGELILAQAEVGGIEQAITAARAEAGGHRLCAHPCRPAGTAARRQIHQRRPISRSGHQGPVARCRGSARPIPAGPARGVA